VGLKSGASLEKPSALSGGNLYVPFCKIKDFPQVSIFYFDMQLPVYTVWTLSGYFSSGWIKRRIEILYYSV